MRRIGIRDVAQVAGVSISTVSKVFNSKGSVDIPISDSTREKVFSAAKKLNYTPNYGAQLLRGQSSRTIGYSIDLPAEHVDGYLSDYPVRILNGLGSAARKENYTLLLISGSDYRSYMDIKRIDGLVINGFTLNDNPLQQKMVEMYKHFNARKYPYFVINNNYTELDIPSVSIDNKAGIDLIMDLIQRRGYESVGFIGELTPNPQLQHEQRKEYLKQGLIESGIKVDERVFINGECAGIKSVPREGLYSHEDGWHAIDYMVRKSILPRCLICGNDDIAEGVIGYCGAHSIRVPEDLAVVGFDGTPTTKYWNPALTTIYQPLEEFGRIAFQFLKRKMNDPDYFESFVLKPTLIERNSA
jgi:DNA-binding LacI/PurR family transcriptional regulator